MSKYWPDPLSLSHEKQTTALIILNEPIPSPRFLSQLWFNSSLRICADGGANRLFDLLTPEERPQWLPDLIKGDLDSLRDDVAAYYRQQNVSVIKDADQYSTDLGKCISHVESLEQSSSTQYRVMLLGGLTGRLDQTAHTLSTLLQLRKTARTIWAFSQMSMACVLDQGSHRIEIDASRQGPTCGILPVGCDAARIWTKGLRWDVDNWETSFDGQMSTSNQLTEAKEVQVSTDKPVVWTCELQYVL